MSAIRHEWFQSDTSVTLDIFIKNLTQDQVKLDLQPTSVSVNIKTSSSSETALDFDLFQHIVPEESQMTILKTKIEIVLKKKMTGLKWLQLEGDGNGDPVQMNTNTDKAPQYPSSSKKKHDWNKVEKEISQEKDGEKQLNEFFQDIFKNASPEAQRAMQKSFIESNGTQLSTNWDEVGKGKVPVTPPEGMVAKPYEK
ncbi:SGS domain-containing protein [Gorgonomyces haynaldii]|nr:SGS domain-containing protein [Gorgonomyces haynaldii]